MNALLFKAAPAQNAGLYRRTQRARRGLYEGVSLLDDRIHSNTAALSTDRLSGQIATINHHLSADLQATGDSLRGACQPLLYSIPVRFPPFLHCWLLLQRFPFLFCLCFSQSLLLYLLLTRRSLKSQTQMPPSVRS